ncbi:MAG: DCC1-like thiol-disulfide oxidoreductase family protein, partial [Bacteroidales bacterium]|nr:DCC1-like thiol-disulfide oxidoreductase family protein [Bacteroidales bacterium]
MKFPIIFFDDICVLCSDSVRFIFRHDMKKQFYFASMNSDSFQELLKTFAEEEISTDSVLLYSKGKIYTRSGAALRIAWRLRFPFPLLSLAFIIPHFLRNAIYDLIARKRYHWFGKLDSCY